MTVTIKKLTPPQVQAVRDAFPHSITRGFIATTASQVTFVNVPGKEPWRLEHVRRLLKVHADATNNPARRSLIQKVNEKTFTRLDLVVEA
jgi:hypothetical protein